MEHTYWISVGRGTGTGPLDNTAWSDFKHQVRTEARFWGEIVTTVDGSSEWNSQPEETYLVLVILPNQRSIDRLASVLAGLAHQYDQEAIGFVGGPGTDTLITP